MTESALVCWDFTIPAENRTPEEIKIWCEEWCNKWGFQKEIGEDNGFIHYQGRIKLIKRLRFGTLVNKKFFDGKVHWTPTSNNCRDGDDFYEYTSKPQTRVEGPWKDNDPKPRRVPEQYRVKEFKPFQQSIIELTLENDNRGVNVIVQPPGAVGKTTIVANLCCAYGAIRIPPSPDYKDVMQYICSLWEQGRINDNERQIFVADLPKGYNNKILKTWWNAIETLKDGWCYNQRHKGSEVWFNKSPIIFIFTNEFPEESFMTSDRWRVWQINSVDETLWYSDLNGNWIRPHGSVPIHIGVKLPTGLGTPMKKQQTPPAIEGFEEIIKNVKLPATIIATPIGVPSNIDTGNLNTPENKILKESNMLNSESLLGKEIKRISDLAFQKIEFIRLHQDEQESINAQPN